MQTLSDPLTNQETQYLDRELDRVKTRVFLNKNAAFLGSLMCSLDFHWSREIPTAGISPTKLLWNPDFFLSLKPAVRESVLIHEIWHLGFLHLFRQNGRDKDDWNKACDHKINLDMQAEGYSWEGIDSWICLDPRYKGMTEEDIFEDIYVQKIKGPTGWTPDLIPGDGSDGSEIIQGINSVVRALQEAQKAGAAGKLPGSIEATINKFLAPVIRWEPIFHRFFTDLIEDGKSWRRPDRRYPDMYLPARWLDEGRLDHLVYFEDVSGSISDDDNLRFTSELKYVWDTMQPKRMDIVQFDTQIQDVKTLLEGDTFEEIKIVGRGGTHLECVRQYIINHVPTAAVIFSDLECLPMDQLPIDIPIIWVAIRNTRAVVPFGQLIHIR